MHVPAPGRRSREPGGWRVPSGLRTPEGAVCAGTAALAALALATAAITGSGWPAVTVVLAAALPAVVQLRRALHVLVLAVVAVSVLAALLLAQDGREAAPWMLLATAAAAGLGVWGVHRYEELAGQLAEVHARHDAVSVHDDLTGCSNHTGLMLFGDHLLQGVRRRGEAMHALFVDVDGLGRVYDRLGRGAGDEVLVVVADALRASTRGTDVVARGTHGHFVVLGPGVGVSPGELERRVRTHLVESPPAPLDLWPCRVTAGLGVLEPWDGGDVTDLLRKAQEDLSMRTSMRAPSAPEPVRRPEPDSRRQP
jgi:diguanylate cyclase (GGDEF)-like protein